MYNNQRIADTRVYDLRLGNLKLKPNFRLSEFQCSDGSPIILLHPEVLYGVQEIRDYFRMPVKINSAYRTFSHNESIPTSGEYSKHLYGMALDIAVKNISPEVVAELAEEMGFGGIGRYSWGIHIDVYGQNRRWDFR